jgi:hypothetical protein
MATAKKTSSKLPSGSDPVTPVANPSPAADDDIRFAELLRRRTGTAYEPLRAFAQASANDRLKIGRRIITDSIIDATEEPDIRFRAVVDESESLLEDYATLDEPHRADIERMIRNIKTYLGDSTRKRPLNALMSATPGAGKSHFIRQLAQAMREEGVQAVTFNMATMRSPDDMGQPVDEFRNLKVRDRYPLLFLDEFDSDESNYATLLPLLWDGELQIGHRHLKLGKAVIVLAGSKSDLAKAMDPSIAMTRRGKSKTAAAPAGKLIDLLSRINGGVIVIPDLDLQTADRDRRVDKVCVTVALLRQKFGDQLLRIPRSLLRFVAHTKFRYGARSIAHLLDEIDHLAYENGELSAARLTLPLTSEELLRASSLRFHLIESEHEIVTRWQAFSSDRSIASLQELLPLWMYE